MEELNSLSKELISLLVFEEAYENLMLESKELNKYAVRDELRGLIVKDYVKPAAEIDTGIRKGFIYDSDKMNEYSYCLTAKGYQLLEKLIKQTNK